MRKVYLERLAETSQGQPRIWKSVVHYQNRDRTLFCQRKYHCGGHKTIVTYEQVNCQGCLERLVWQTWDWTKYDAQLAAEHKLTRERIRQIRILLHKPKHTYWDENKERVKVAVNSWDWTKTDKEIAAIQGVHTSRVSYLRRKFHKPKVKSVYKRKPAKWTKEKLDALFADHEGTILAISARHGMPYTSYYRYKKWYDSGKY